MKKIYQSGLMTMSNVTKYVILVCFVSILGFKDLYAQCKLDRSKDDFSGVVTIQTKPFIIMPISYFKESKMVFWDIYLSFGAKDNKLFLILDHKTSAPTNIKSFDIKFTNDSVLQYEGPSERGPAKRRFAEDITYSSFEIAKEELTKFSQYDVQKMRVTFEDDAKFPAKTESKFVKANAIIQQNASCVLSEFNAIK